MFRKPVSQRNYDDVLFLQEEEQPKIKQKKNVLYPVLSCVVISSFMFAFAFFKSNKITFPK